MMAWDRLLTPNFLKMLLTWIFTVLSLMNNCSAISLLLSPFTIHFKTSSSRGVRKSSPPPRSILRSLPLKLSSNFRAMTGCRVDSPR